ncbi:MAG: hypothetical protein GY754_15275, partial [bacterium]|nr:hypothetical protein [bacterium]
MKKIIMKLFVFMAAISPVFMAGCIIDDSAVALNTYSIESVTAPVDITRSGASAITNPDRKVHIGHDLPINLELTAEYAEDDVPIQVYLLNINDIEEVQSGIGD